MTVLPAFRGGCDDLGMAINVRELDRDQQFLMPPSLAEWLPADHLAWFVLDVVAKLDLGGFYADLRSDGRGGAAYDPAMMLAVLLYGYCPGPSFLAQRSLLRDRRPALGQRRFAAGAVSCRPRQRVRLRGSLLPCGTARAAIWSFGAGRRW